MSIFASSGFVSLMLKLSRKWYGSSSLELKEEKIVLNFSVFYWGSTLLWRPHLLHQFAATLLRRHALLNKLWSNFSDMDHSKTQFHEVMSAEMELYVWKENEDKWSRIDRSLVHLCTYVIKNCSWEFQIMLC